MEPSHNFQQPPEFYPWKKYLPSKKIRILIITIIILGSIYSQRNFLVALVTKIPDTFSSQQKLPDPLLTQNVRNLSLDRDTDGDGFPDWQEALFGTDPEDPFSFPEGTTEEAEFIRISNEIISIDDKFALSVYERARTEPVGNNFEENIQGAMSKELLDLADSLESKMKIYSLDDLTITENTSGNRSVYGNQMARILNSLELTEQNINEAYQSILEKKPLDKNLENLLTKSIKELLTVSVPLNIAENHLVLVNALVRIEQSFNHNVSYSQDDTPVFAFVLILQKNINVAEKAGQDILLLLSVFNNQ